MPAFCSVTLVLFGRNAFRMGVMPNVHIEAQRLLRAQCSTGNSWHILLFLIYMTPFFLAFHPSLPHRRIGSGAPRPRLPSG
eukprot:4050605-Pyramimonas_sp.AAC.1